jgi:hypothetical protein
MRLYAKASGIMPVPFARMNQRTKGIGACTVTTQNLDVQRSGVQD